MPSLVTTIRVMVGSDGVSNIKPSSTSSMMARSPRAPVFRSIARSAMVSSACGSNSSCIPSSSNSFLYCLTSEFFGSVRMRTRLSLSSPVRVAIIGRRPTSSGISPNLTKSCGVICPSRTSCSNRVLSLICAPKPREDCATRFSMAFWMPSNAPPQMNRILEVSICKNSWFGCFLPPFGGTFATVPSIILSSAC